jgi:hypothetical protein
MPDILGIFRVNKHKFWKSDIQYAVMLFKDRILFVKIGGQFADGGTGAIIGSILGGAAGGMLGGMIGGRIGQGIEGKTGGSRDMKREKTMQAIQDLSIEELLQTDKNNFQIPYEEINYIKIKKILFWNIWR